MKKTGALLTALLLTGYAMISPLGSIPQDIASAADGYEMNITVDLSGERKEISPYIYGVNQYGNQDNYKNIKVNAVRQGGNRMTAYNWENNASNAGSDWKHSSDDNLSRSDRPADCAQVLSAEGEKYGFDYKLTTLQLAGYVAADKDGTVSEEEAAPSSRWNEVVLTKNAPFDDTPDLTDGKVYMDEYVNYLINTLGNSRTSAGIQGYSLDNEPALWDHTHSRIHPQPVSMKELSDKSVEMALAVKKLDPDAEIFGPALYGYTAYDHLDDDDNSSEWEEIQSANGYNWYIDYYLDVMKKASEESGVRLLDVLDIHYYSESARVGAEDRVQSVRTLYEEGFVENSWIGQWCQKNVPILPTIKESIDQYYPGTKLGITEYNFGGGDDVSGTIAQAEALGCYADQGVYFATLWGNEPYILSGINLYTNYDGKGGSFGDTLIPAVTDDVSLASSYAAVDSEDDSLVTVMITNKNMTESENAAVMLKNADKDYKSAAIYAIYGDSDEIRLLDVEENIEGNNLNVTLPAFSAAMVVISEDADAFADLTGTDTPKTEEKTVIFDDPMSMINENGFVEIPISDPENLKKVILTADVTSSAGSSWGTAGCAVSINAVDESGTDFWTSKSYSLSLGTDSSATIKFDGTFSKDEEEVKAVIADGKIELQKWWDASEKQEQEIEDEITVKYTSVQVVYEFTESDLPSDSTETTEPDEEIVWGDADENGAVNILDVILLNRTIMGRDELTEQGEKNADVDVSGTPDSTDALNILKLIVGLLKQTDFPVR